MPSDGLAIWTALRNETKAEMRDLLPLVAPLLKSFQFLHRSKYENALRHARRACSRDPAHPSTQLAMGMASFYSGKIAEGDECLRGLLNNEHPTVKTPEFQAAIDSQLALIGILSPDPVRWPLARERAEGAYRETPWDNSVALIYGACVTLNDGLEAGAKILDTVTPKTKETRDFCTCVRALALARAGRLRDAAEVLATVRPQKEFDVLRAAIEEILGTESIRCTRIRAAK
jgi:hypothetical protein